MTTLSAVEPLRVERGPELVNLALPVGKIPFVRRDKLFLLAPVSINEVLCGGGGAFLERALPLHRLALAGSLQPANRQLAECIMLLSIGFAAFVELLREGSLLE